MAANIYNSTAPNNSPPSYHPQEPTSDDVSLFLQQIILRSNSSPASSSSNTPLQPFAAFSDLGSGAFSNSGQISVPNPNHSSSRFALAAANGPPSSIVRFDNESDDYDYESEEVAEAVVEEMTARATPPCRRSSKRSRSAQVHNQSEKRRRSRINEKMKALQNLIPNSNKTDKASMLDDAIEYLKQLQLQVQMLTMKNGLSLHANCVPETLLQQPNDQYTSQVRMEGNETIYMDHQNISADPLIRLQDKCTNKKSTPARVTDFSCIIAPKTSVKVESESTVAHRIPYQRPSSSKEKVRICQPSSEDCLRTSSTGAKAITSIPCETNTSKMNDTTLEARLAGGDHLLQNFVNHPMFSSHSSM